ncbi:MAG TPA: Rid family hydrolase [Candidatus Thermoplasmatota archaeon]|nr:Rid family hydrolase [Candidatus Thermoplasmatota archaeon]
MDSPKSPQSLSGPGVIAGFVVPGLPHPLLVPDANPAYRKVRDAYEAVRKEIEALRPDLLLLYSTQWLSVIGHQVQARAQPEWRHVDPEWHELGTIPYRLRMDPAFGAAYVAHGQQRGLEMRTVDHHGFPIDTGTVVALKLLNPDNAVPASVVSCNMYADRAETIVLGKAARDAVAATGKRVVAIAVTALSNRLHTDIVPFAKDRIHSLKDDEWNRKYLEVLGEGRLESASQLAREFSTQASGDQKMKAVWWLAATLGQSNRYTGRVFEYQPLYGTGAALVGLWPSAKAAADQEFDEDDAERYGGDRNVLGPAGKGATQVSELTMEEQDKWEPATPEHRGGTPLLEAALGSARSKSQISQMPQTTKGRPMKSVESVVRPESGVVTTTKAPKPLAAYAHARRVGDLLFLAGIGPRDPKTNATTGGPVRDASGRPLEYDVKAQTRQCIENIRTILAESGASLADVFDVSVFLIDMQNDFAAFNEVYNEYFGSYQPARTTVQVEALPGPIGVELKVVAKLPA